MYLEILNKEDVIKTLFFEMMIFKVDNFATLVKYESFEKYMRPEDYFMIT